MTLDPGALYQEALASYGKGRWEEAEAACNGFSNSDTHYSNALNIRGMIAYMRGRPGEAADLFRQAIAADRSVPAFHNNLGNALQAIQQLTEARGSFQEAIRLHPTFAEAYINLGNLCHTQGLSNEALAFFEEALHIQPDNVDARYNLGNTLASLERYEEAIAQFQEVLIRQPQYAEAYGSLAGVFMSMDRPEDAAGMYLEAIRTKPSAVEYHCALGNAFRVLGLFPEAVSAFQEALRQRPAFAHAWHDLGYLYQTQGRFTEACAAYEQAVAAGPTRPETFANLARVYLALERHEDALKAANRAVANDSRFHPGIEALFHVSRVQCAWDRLSEIGTLYQAAIEEELEQGGAIGCSPFTALWLPLQPAIQRALVERLSSEIAAPLMSLRAAQITPSARVEQARLKIGYLSSDYRAHATAHLLGHLFNLHDRSRFEVICYSSGPDDGSAYRKRFETEAERFVDVHLWPPLEIANHMRLAGIDILVDLHGHTTGSNCATLALRPAPLQIHFLGYPGTVGKDLVDYSLVDAVICPPGHQQHYSEQVYRLPDIYQINDRQPIADTLPRRAYGLPDSGFIFCCFNASYKITPEIFSGWLRILDRVRDSILWLYLSNPAMEQNLRTEAYQRGFPQDRIIFGPALPKDRHLARLRHADLFLDTPSVNAMTTAGDALWAGVPVLSILGDSCPSRAGASILTAIGLPELIMPNLAAYEETAVRLATHPDEMAALKSKLAVNRLTYPLFDTPRFVRNLEVAYEELWARHLAEAEGGSMRATAAAP